MRVDIHLFGEFELQIGGRPVALKGAKPQALLAWLAAGLNKTHPRDRLTGMFWGDHGESNARTNLRQALSALRRVLPADTLVTDGDGLRLASEDLWVDVVEFARLVRSSSIADRWQAASIYDGDLLDGFRAKAPAFEDWLLLEREAYRRTVYELLEGLLAEPEIQRDPSRGIEVCGRLLNIDPTNEQIHRQLMRFYAQAGRTSSALRQFKVCEDALQRELNTAPALETVQLMRAIKSGEVGAETLEQPPPGTSSQSPSPTPTSAAQPMVDLDSEAQADSGSAADRSPRLPSIIVLPFASMSSDAEHGYLADGMTEELINMLANCVNWRVTARNTSFKFKDKNVDVRDLGKDLGVDYVVEGSIRRVADRIRVTAQLVNTTDGTHIWSDRYDRPLTEIFDVQDEVVHAIFRVLRNRIGFAERERVRRTPSANLDAWGLLVKAGQVRVRDARTRDEQRELIRAALAIDADYPRAHAFLASVVYTSVGRGSSSDPKGDLQLGRRHYEAALANGHTDILVLKLCAGGMAAIGDSRQAMDLAERAYALARTPDPLLVAVLMWNGRLAEAQRHCEAIVDQLPPGLPTSPGELRPVALLGNIHMLQGNLDMALDYGRQDAAANPDNFFSYVNLANVLGLRGELDAARDQWASAQELVPGLTREAFILGYRRVMTTEKMADLFGAGLAAAGID